MRILKGTIDNLTTVAGEMLNIETSTLHYIDGTPTELGPNYRGYPKIIDDNETYIIKAAAGYVFVADGTDLEDFEARLMKELLRLESAHVPLDGKMDQPLRGYQTIRAGFTTNIKVGSMQNLSRLASEDKTGNNSASNVKRQFRTPKQGYSGHNIESARFTWHIQPISEMDMTLTSENAYQSVSRYACSIFLDTDQICKHPHNHVTFEFSSADLVGSDQITGETVHLFAYGNPLLVELSDYWRNLADTSAQKFLRSVPSNKVYTFPYEVFQFHPVKFSAEAADSTTGICVKCRGVLWGDNYVLAGWCEDPDNPLCSAICPLCLHSTTAEKPIERDYYRIFRTTFPRSAEQMLENPQYSDQLKDICREALISTEVKTTYINDREVQYTMIGKKYLGFKNTNDYLFTSLCLLPDFIGRKVCRSIVTC